MKSINATRGKVRIQRPTTFPSQSKSSSTSKVDGVEGRSSSGQLACTQKGPVLGRKMAADADREGKRWVTRERKRGGERKEGEGGGRIKRRWKG